MVDLDLKYLRENLDIVTEYINAQESVDDSFTNRPMNRVVNIDPEYCEPCLRNAGYTKCGCGEYVIVCSTHLDVVGVSRRELLAYVREHADNSTPPILK